MSLPTKYLGERRKEGVEALGNDLFATKKLMPLRGWYSLLLPRPYLMHTLFPVPAFIPSFQESLEEMQIGVSCK